MKLKYIFFVFLIFIFSSAIGQDISNGRIAYYKFNGNANDEVGNNHGAVNGANLVSDRFGNINSAYQFDGVDDFVEIPDNASINFGADDDFSISLWVNISPDQNDMRGNNNEILGKWNALNNTGYPYAIRYWNNDAISPNQQKIFTLRYDSQFCGGGPTTSGSCKISTGQWHHLVFRKKNNELSLFQDGTLLGTETDNTSLVCNTKNNLPVMVGKRGLNQRYFTGLIDDISFYNRALSDEEVSILLNQNQWIPPTFETEIISFNFPGQIGSTMIDNMNHLVEIELECNTDLTKLTGDFSLSSGATASVGGINQISGITTNDFTIPLVYAIYNGEGCIEQDWTVKVRSKQLSQEEINLKVSFQGFGFSEQTNAPIFDQENHTIDVKVRCGSDISNLVSNFTLSDGSSTEISGRSQESGITPNDFSNPVVYTVYDDEGCATRDWTITVKVQEFLSDLGGGSSEGLLVPNIFTPNDDGINDTFELGRSLFGSEVTIYNRYGRKLYYNSNYMNEFRGDDLSSGVYYFIIKNKCFQKPMKGHVSILK